MNKVLSAAVLSFTLFSSQISVGELSFQPEDITEFWITPETPSTLTWKVIVSSATTQPAKAEPDKYVIRDYGDNVVASGQATAAKDGKIMASLSLPTGYYSLEFASTKQRFGIVSIDPFTGKKDSFFCIDTALSWLVGKTNTAPSREGLIRVLARSGVAMARERLGWNETLQPELDKWNWEGDNDYDTIRKCYAKNGVPLLELFHTSPAHVGKAVGAGPFRLPQDMLKVASSWKQMGTHWQSSWGALEVWNELDGAFFSGNAPADQYAPLVKTIAYTFDHEGIKTPMVGGVVAYGWDEGYLDLAQRNGVLDNIDAWSVHTYGHNSSLKIQNFMEVYRKAFKKYNKISMPIWDTESGFAWTAKGPMPPADQDAACAMEITMKGIECLSCGMARYFPFVFPFYAEEICNYSMTDKAGTPLRSIAAYAWAIKTLSNRTYLGDWRCKNASVTRARVFGDKDDVVLVLFTGNILPIANVSDEKTNKPAQMVQIPLPDCNVEIRGIDGRRLTLGKNKEVPVPDGLAYVFMKRKDIDKYLDTQTQAMELYKIGRLPAPVRKAPSPIVLQFRPDATQFYEADVKGYVPVASAPEKLPFPVDVTNLSKEPCEVHLNLQAKTGQVGHEQVLTVPALKTVRVEWQIPWTRKMSQSPNSYDLKLGGSSSDGTAVDPVFLRFRGRPSLESWLGLFSKRQKLPITNMGSWHPSAIAGATMNMSSPDANTWQLDVNFNKAIDRWVYPRFDLPDNLNLTRFKGIVFEGRCRAGALAVRTVLWERQADGGEITFMTGNILNSDDQWHPVFVPFTGSDFGASGVDPNNKLKLNQVKVMSFGMNSGAAENTLQIRNVWLVGD
jgi:hypothetical protein